MGGIVENSTTGEFFRRCKSETKWKNKSIPLKRTFSSRSFTLKNSRFIICILFCGDILTTLQISVCCSIWSSICDPHKILSVLCSRCQQYINCIGIRLLNA